MPWIASRRRFVRDLMVLVSVSLVGAAGATLLGLAPVGAGFVGAAAGAVAGGLLAFAMARAAQRPGAGRAIGVSFLPRAALLLAAFLWARHLWPADVVWIVPGYLTGEAVWVARALGHLRRTPPPDRPARVEE